MADPVIEPDLQAAHAGMQRLLALVLPLDASASELVLGCLRNILTLESAAVRLSADTQDPTEDATELETGHSTALRLLRLPIGQHEQLGTLVCTSFRQSFPTAHELLLLQLAADKLALGLHETRSLAAQQSSATRAERERLARALGVRQLLSTVAHEINQPLAAIVSNANASTRWLAHDPPNAAEARAAAQRIPRDAERASALVARARDVTRSTTSRLDILSVAALLHDVVAIVYEQARGQGVTLRVTASKEGYVRGDRAELEQLLLLLVENALEAMAESTTKRVLSLETGLDDNGAVLLSISDTGVGIGVESHDRVFEPLYSSKPGRLGLGLSICRALVQAHDGRLWSAPAEQGATFCITLPRHTA